LKNLQFKINSRLLFLVNQCNNERPDPIIVYKVDAKHLNSYLDELEWRFNNRENPYLFRDTLKKLIESENLEYQKLIA